MSNKYLLIDSDGVAHGLVKPSSKKEATRLAKSQGLKGEIVTREEFEDSAQGKRETKEAAKAQATSEAPYPHLEILRYFNETALTPEAKAMLAERDAVLASIGG